MPSHSYRTQIAIGATVDNIMIGTPWLTLPRPAVIKVYACQNGAVLPAPLLMDCMIGDAVKCDGKAIKIRPVGEGPEKPEDLVLRDGVPPFAPIVIRLRNPGAAASDPAIEVDIDFVG